VCQRLCLCVPARLHIRHRLLTHPLVNCFNPPATRSARTPASGASPSWPVVSLGHARLKSTGSRRIVARFASTLSLALSKSAVPRLAPPEMLSSPVTHSARAQDPVAFPIVDFSFAATRSARTPATGASPHDILSFEATRSARAPGPGATPHYVSSFATTRSMRAPGPGNPPRRCVPSRQHAPRERGHRSTPAPLGRGTQLATRNAGHTVLRGGTPGLADPWRRKVCFVNKSWPACVSGRGGLGAPGRTLRGLPARGAIVAGAAGFASVAIMNVRSGLRARSRCWHGAHALMNFKSGLRARSHGWHGTHAIISFGSGFRARTRG